MDYSYRGKSTLEFESILSEYIGSYVVATNTGTAALHLALLLSGVKAHDYVLCPSISYVSTANSILYCNASPEFMDAGDDLNVDIDKLERYLYHMQPMARTKFIMITHVLGKPCNMWELTKVLYKYRLTLIEDACQALGSFYDGQHCGTFGRFGAISFNGNKIITTGGGGALICKRKEDYRKALHLSTVAKDMIRKQCYHTELGYNYRMPAWNAQLGIKQFKKSKRLQPLKERSKHEAIVCNGWGKIDKDGMPIWTPLHLLPHLEDCPKMNCDNAERIGREVNIKVNCNNRM
jgi:perosamine synthetase